MVDLLNEKQFRKMNSYNKVVRSRVPYRKFSLCLPLPPFYLYSKYINDDSWNNLKQPFMFKNWFIVCGAYCITHVSILCHEL